MPTARLRPFGEATLTSESRLITLAIWVINSIKYCGAKQIAEDICV
jgi:hypothetical protein